MKETNWLIVYEDNDVDNEVFTSEKSARSRLEQVIGNWNCCLFKQMFDEAAVKNEWKPNKGDLYYSPRYQYGKWGVMLNENSCKIDKEVSNKGEAFKTESACRQYMNSKNWINDGKLWE